MDRVFRKYINAYDLQDSRQILVQTGSLVENGHHQVSADGDPNLGLHRVLARAVEGLDPQVLLDPFEEQLDLPASLVEFRHDQRIDLEVVGYEDEQLSRFRIPEAYPPQVAREELPGLRPVEADGLVGSQAGGLVHGAGLADVVAHVGLGPGDEEGPGRMDGSQTEEIYVSTIQYVEGSDFEDDPIQGVDVVGLPLGDRDEHGDRAAQVDHRVELDRGLSLAKAGPWEEVHAQVYRGGVDGVDDLVHVQDVSFRAIQLAGLADEDLAKLEVDHPASMLVGVGQVAFGYDSLDSHRIEQSRLGPEACFDVAPALPEGKLREEHAQKLVPSREASRGSRHRVLGDAPCELLRVNQIDDLGKNELSVVHENETRQANTASASSNRSHISQLLISWITSTYQT